MQRIEVLKRIQRNPQSVAPWDPKADQLIPADGISHARRSCIDDNGMWLGDAMHWELQRVVACALANQGTAAIVLADGSSLTVNLNVPGFGGKPRWGGYHKGYLCGGGLYILEAAKQIVQGKPKLETVGGQVVHGNHLDPAKIVVERVPEVHHIRAPDRHVYHSTTW